MYLTKWREGGQISSTTVFIRPTDRDDWRAIVAPRPQDFLVENAQDQSYDANGLPMGLQEAIFIHRRARNRLARRIAHFRNIEPGMAANFLDSQFPSEWVRHYWEGETGTDYQAEVDEDEDEERRVSWVVESNAGVGADGTGDNGRGEHGSDGNRKDGKGFDGAGGDDGNAIGNGKGREI